MAAPIAVPYVNGVRHDFTRIQIYCDRLRYFEIMDISYSSSQDGGKVRGAGSSVRGRTAGLVDHDGGMTLYRTEFENFAAALQLKDPTEGLATIPFTIKVNFGKLAGLMTTDTLVGCRIKKIDQSHKEGSDALVVKLDLNPIDVLYGNLQLSMSKDQPY
jgi:hypothetical protein